MRPLQGLCIRGRTRRGQGRQMALWWAPGDGRMRTGSTTDETPTVKGPDAGHESRLKPLVDWQTMDPIRC